MLKFALTAFGLLLLGSPNAHAQNDNDHGIEIVGGAHIASAPFQLVDNRIFVEARINGRGPFHMIFDTGGSNLVTPEVAHAMNLTLTDPFQTSGVGDAQSNAWHTHVNEAALGAIRLRNLEFVVISTEDIRRAIGFQHWDGLFGSELLHRFVVHIDYDAHRISFAEPRYAPRNWFAGASVPIGFVENLPMIHARLGDIDVRAIVDTGDRSSLTLFGPFVDAHHLRDSGAPRIRAVTGWGIGGPVPADVGRSGDLSFSRFTLHGVTTRLPVTHSGGFASDDADASIGTGVLKRFALTFDYSRRLLVLSPNRHIGDADPFDRSGMWLRQTQARDAIEIFDVTPNTPAADAGLHAGDRIVAVDGHSLNAASLIAFRERLSASRDGERFSLRVQNAGGERDAALVIREPHATG